MAGSRGGGGRKGNGDVASLTLEILRGIRSGIEGLRDDNRAVHSELRALNERVDVLTERVDGLNMRVDGLNARVDALERATARGFELVTARLENIRDLAGEQYRKLEERVGVVETRLARLAGARR
ncbi:MAG: hypothetical protein HYY06_26655 [Deltaproteobacteria bacterium]|nr:hypothetical protein [Deltaproteobacteria bacterium]